MINDNVLADRLNQYREGKLEEPEFELNEEDFKGINTKISNFLTIVFKIAEAGTIFLRSLAFGFAAKTIFGTDWKFIAFLAIGFTVEIVLTNIFNIFKK